MPKIKEMDVFDIILGLENGELKVKNDSEMDRVIDLCKTFSTSTNYYRRMYPRLVEWRANPDRFYPITL